MACKSVQRCFQHGTTSKFVPVARRSNRCLSCSAQEKQVFQLTASRQNLTYEDLWAASETCDLLNGPNREECYASFGVDAERLDMYLGRTLCLEATYQASGEDRPTRPSSGPVAVVQGVVAVPVQSAVYAKAGLDRFVGALGHLRDELKNSARLMFD